MEKVKEVLCASLKKLFPSSVKKIIFSYYDELVDPDVFLIMDREGTEVEVQLSEGSELYKLLVLAARLLDFTELEELLKVKIEGVL